MCIRDSTTGAYNTAVGGGALDANTTAGSNTAVGYNSLTANTTGADNTAVGTSSLTGNTTGSFNTAVGYQAMSTSSAGPARNVAMGYQAGTALTNGSYNTFVGMYAGNDVTTGGGNLAIGYGMTVTAGGSVRGHIGYNNGSTGTADYAITFGRGGTDWSRLSYGGSSFTTGSDERKKKDITDHPLGLDFIKQLRTVNYHFKAPSDVPEEWDTHKASETEEK